MYRFVVIAIVIVGVGLAAPRFAPGLFGSLTGADGRTADDVVAAAPTARAESAPQDVQPPEFAEAASPLPVAPSGRRAAIPAASDGHYYADATINGRKVPVVVDTGATAVVLTETTARQLGIFPPRSAFTARVQTANGEVAAALVTLREVRLDGVRVAEVKALVLPRLSLEVNLLGMSFLGRLTRFEAAGGELVLTQ